MKLQINALFNPPTIASNPQPPIVNVEQSCGPALVTPIVPLHQASVASNSKLVRRPERKFNIVIYDLANAVQVLSKAVESVSSQSIRDCYVLGSTISSKLLFKKPWKFIFPK